jgi:hypothetical protein
LIDELPVIVDWRVDVEPKYTVSYGGGKLWD